MSIEGKHAYRFLYLKSSKWQDVRLQALVREKGKCQICGEESISNDAHHMWYPESVWDTTEEHLVILCRCCHDFIHAMIPECKTSDPEEGRANWIKFRNSILTWRQEKIFLFTSNPDCPSLIPPPTPGKPEKASELRAAYDKLKVFAHNQKLVLKAYAEKFGELPELESIKDGPGLGISMKSPRLKEEPGIKPLIGAVQNLLHQYEHYVKCVKSEVADSDFQI